ncbi:unnamed protein product [Schistosoma curassoni]|uniref:Uncharacterized protein n=1 Tax=Schistosoma curassoni TaxID=6186 RepID=A0A183KFE2_9TREM|nr:unnamed protein product [Schistosoma curassoni]
MNGTWRQKTLETLLVLYHLESARLIYIRNSDCFELFSHNSSIVFEEL